MDPPFFHNIKFAIDLHIDKRKTGWYTLLLKNAISSQIGGV